MDLDLSPDHVLLRDTIRDFMETEVAPVVDQHERERRFPIEIVRRIGELGWLGINVPERWGGAGHGHARLRDRGRGDRPGLGLARADRRGPHEPRLRPADDRRHRRAARPLADAAGVGRGHRRLRAHRADRRAPTPAGPGRRRAARTAPTAARGSSTARSGSSPTPATPGRTSSRPRPGEHADGSSAISAFIVPADAAGLQRRPARGQDGPPRLGDRRAAVRRHARPGGQPAGRGGRRLPGVPQGARRRPDLDRRRWRSASPRPRSTRRSRTPRSASSSGARSGRSRGSRS